MLLRVFSSGRVGGMACAARALSGRPFWVPCLAVPSDRRVLADGIWAGFGDGLERQKAPAWRRGLLVFRVFRGWVLRFVRDESLRFADLAATDFPAS